MPTPGSAILEGNALTNASESQLAFNRTVEELTLTIRLMADSWAPSIGNDDGATSAVLNSIRSLQGEPYGWNAIVRPGLAASPHVATRASSTVLHVALPFFPLYAITHPETIVVTIPVGALTSNQSIVAAPALRVQAMAGFALIEGDLTNRTYESRVRLGERIDFNLTLRNETWLAGVGETETPAQRLLGETLIRGILPSGRWGGEPSGWLHVVQPALLAMPILPLTRVGDDRIIFSLPAAPNYDITAPETLTLTVHPTLVVAEAAVVADPLVPIRVQPGIATLHGTLICTGGRYETYTVSPPPPSPPPPVGLSLPFAPPPPSAPSPPATPPDASGDDYTKHNCNNTEAALSGHGDHVLTVTLTNGKNASPTTRQRAK